MLLIGRVVKCYVQPWEYLNFGDISPLTWRLESCYTISTRRANTPCVRDINSLRSKLCEWNSQSRLNVLGGPGPARQMGPLSSL